MIWPLILLIASAVGVVPALLANGVGSIIMIKLGTWFPLLRFPLVWGLAGGVLAWAVARRLEGEPEWPFPFTAASALSALICRMRLA